MHGWADGRLRSWGKGRVVWQGQLFLQMLLLPQNTSGRKMEGWWWLGNVWCLQAAGGQSPDPLRSVWLFQGSSTCGISCYLSP